MTIAKDQGKPYQVVDRYRDLRWTAYSTLLNAQRTCEQQAKELATESGAWNALGVDTLAEKYSSLARTMQTAASELAPLAKHIDAEIAEEDQ